MSDGTTECVELASDVVDGGLCIVPLGGLAEVGMNCMLYELDGQILIVDCGINFPEEEDYGIDLIIPSFAYLSANADRVVGLIVTHGHEDHIGAIPYLLREINPPIYGTPLALALIKRRLKEQGLYEHADLRELTAGDTISVGPFDIEPVHVNHSIPQTVSLAIETPVGVIVHSSDFKVDHTPGVDEPIDLGRFAALGEEGVLCLLSDSTNVDCEGSSKGEAEVKQGLLELIERAPGRVLVTLFASNLYRVQSLLDIAHSVGRRVVMLGRSLLQNVAVARELGLIHLPDENISIEPSEMEAFRHDQILVLATGSQGEPRSALTRISMGDHSLFEVVPGDQVIYSSRVIPGNEVSINRVINHLYKRGAEVHQSSAKPIHATGHAHREEQKLMLSLTQPLFFVPIHGEYRMLARHAAMAKAMGVEDTFILENGDILGLWEDSGEIVGRAPAGRVLVDGKGTDDLPSVVLQDRRKLARTGIVVAWLVLDVNTGDIINGPNLSTHGVIGSEAGDDILAEAACAATKAIESLSTESRCASSEVAETMRIAVRRVFNRRIESKPVVVPIVHEL